MEEWQAWVEKCPIKRVEKKVIEMDKNLKVQLSKIDGDLVNEIDEAFKFAMSSEYPNPQDLLKGMWA